MSDCMWVILDNRIEPGVMQELVVYRCREDAEEQAHKLRQHYECPLDAIQVEAVVVL